MQPLGIQSIKVGEKNRMEVTAGYVHANPFIFTLTRPLKENETVQVQCHIYEPVYNLNRTIGIFQLSMKPQEENKWFIHRDPPSCDSEPVLIMFPEDLAGATVTLIFSLQIYSLPPKNFDSSLLLKKVTVDVLSNEREPRIEEVYWCDSKEIRYGQLSEVRTATLFKNETIYLHIHTRGMYGKQVECICNRGISRIVDIRNNIATLAYTFTDNSLNELIVSCRRMREKSFEKSATIPVDPANIFLSVPDLQQVYAQPGERGKEHYASMARCRVDFRPKKGYDGSFGFSWYRIGDLVQVDPLNVTYPSPRILQDIAFNYCNDHPFSDVDFPGYGIMGRHYETIELTHPVTNAKIKQDRIVRSPNDSGTGCPGINFEDIDGKAVGRDNFIPDTAMSEDHKDEYVKICINGYQDIPYMEEYLVPVMTLQCGQEVELQLLLRVIEPPKIILFAFDNPRAETEGFLSFAVKQNQIDTPIIDPDIAPVDDSIISYTIRITCHKVFDRELRLKAYAIPKVETDESLIVAHKENGRVVPDVITGYPLILPELCGMLRILPNDDAHWRKIKVVFFNVITNTSGKEKNGIAKGSTIEKENLNKFLAQAYVVADTIADEEIDLASVEADRNDYLNCCLEETDINGKKVFTIDDSKKGDLQKLLNGKIPAGYPETDYFRIFFLPERGSVEYGGKGGFYSPNEKFAVCYAGVKDEVPVHELLHAMGLPHTFNGNTDRGASYTYEDGKTDNIMDYSLNRYSLFEWQWYAINMELKK